MKKSSKPKFIIIILLVFIAVHGAMKVAQYTYENRCYVLKCSPVSWKEILDTTFAQAGNNFRIDGIYASPQWSSDTEAEPEFVSIHVMYVSLESDPSRAGEETNHPVKYFEFDDRNLKTIIQTEGGGGWAGNVPTEDSQDKLRKVTVPPRDAFRVTWILAKNESSMSLESSYVVAQLVFDETLLLFDDIKKNGGDPTWIVSYDNDEIGLTYHVNAQTSQVIGFFKYYK
jgi:hypothetical protein